MTHRGDGLPEEQQGYVEKTHLAQTPSTSSQASYQSCIAKRPSTSRGAWAAGENSDTLLATSIDGRFPYLDIMRVICVWLVVVDHGGTAFGVWNVMYVQGWVLQYLFLIAGICFGMSSSPLHLYLGRLFCYFVVGVGCNFVAYIIKGLDWRGNLWNVIFQLWFVVGLMGFLALLAPLKVYLASVRERVNSEAPVTTPWEELQWYMTIMHGLFAVGGGIIGIQVVWQYALIPLVQHFLTIPIVELGSNSGYGAEHWGLPKTEEVAQIFLSDLCGYMAVSAISVYIIVVFPLISSQTPLVGWLVILNTYGHRVICYRAQAARMINSFDVTMLGMTVYFLGLRHRQVVGRYLTRYWFLTLFCCALLWPPGAHGRFDEHPPLDLSQRVMDNLQEALLVILFLTSIDRIFDPAMFMTDFRTQNLWALSMWAMVLFLVHKAIHIVLSPPLNWVLCIALYLPIWMCRPRTPPKVRFATDASGEEQQQQQWQQEQP